MQTTTQCFEGEARLTLPSEGPNISTVFFNPKMGLNRDMAILFTRTHFRISRPLQLCDPMTASGVRAIRYVLECPNVGNVVAADKQSESLLTARRNVELNGLSGRISVVESDANHLLMDSSNRRFDLVDLDPFGSPAPFFENALRATQDGGVIAATATDMAPLTGARYAACVRKYGIAPVRAEFEKEMAIRILSANLAMCAGKLELGIEIAFAHATDHYARIFATVRKGKRIANESSRWLGFIGYCPGCLGRTAHSSLKDLRNVCELCGTKMQVGGPIWLGRLWNGLTVRNMLDMTPTLKTVRLSEIQRMLELINEEANEPPFHFRTDIISRTFQIKPPAIHSVLSKLRESGFTASRTHFHPNGFRTNAPVKEVISVLRARKT